MTIDQFIVWKIAQDDRVRDVINNSYVNAQMENIKLMRSLIIHLITISSAIIGFTIPVFGRTDLIKSPVFLIGGLAELLIVILYGFWYLVWTLQKENRALTVQHEKYSTHLNRVRDARNKFFSEATEPNKQEWLRIQKEVLDNLQKSAVKNQTPDYSLDIIFGAFFIALLLIVLSLISI